MKIKYYGLVHAITHEPQIGLLILKKDGKHYTTRTEGDSKVTLIYRFNTEEAYREYVEDVLSHLDELTGGIWIREEPTDGQLANLLFTFFDALDNRRVVNYD